MKTTVFPRIVSPYQPVVSSRSSSSSPSFTSFSASSLVQCPISALLASSHFLCISVLYLLVTVSVILNLTAPITQAYSCHPIDKTLINSSSPPPITIGYLTNLNGRHTVNRQGLVISGAITYAVEHINTKRPELLGGRKLKFIFNDNSAISLNSTTALISQWQSGAVAFIGPEDTCEVEATIASALNLPMISYKCTNSAVSNKALYPTFARTHPPDAIVVRSLLALLRYYQWNKFAIVWYKASQKFAPVVSSLRSAAAAGNFVVNTEYPFEDNVQCCIMKEKCCGKIWSDVVEKTYRKTRIYVFLGEGSMLPFFLLALKLRGLLERGDYVVISVELDEDYSTNQTYSYINQRGQMNAHEIDEINQASRSLLVIARSPPKAHDYTDFVDKVRKYNKLEPFNMSDNLPLQRHITYYAAYLYDAVILYAEALSQIFKDGLNECYGRDIIKKIIEFRKYQSVTGAIMYIDQNGDVEGNYTVLRAVLTKPDPSNKSEATSAIFMDPVGTFQFDDASNQTVFIQTGKFDWVRPGHVPLDEPPCGFDDKDCDKSETRFREIITSILVAILIGTLIAISITYRNWKNEQEIDGLLWKISKGLIFEEDEPRILTASRASLMSNGSFTQARLNDLVYTKVGRYNGAHVAVKEFRFNKVKKSSITNPFDFLTRDNKKEMKFIKDMHHKNINPFIGACIHNQYPSSVFIVSELCSKGSLKDVLENDEIKLEEDFLSSFFYDIMSAIVYLHKSEIRCHGNLKSTNCLITSRWVVKLTDFGLHQLRATAETDSSAGDKNYYNLLWKAPELLRDTNAIVGPESDIYSFGILIHELVVREGPFGIKEHSGDEGENYENEDAKMIIEQVKKVTPEGNECRPNTQEIQAGNEIIEIMKSCWCEDPKARPTIEGVRSKFKACQRYKPPSGNIVDKMMKMMDGYQNQLEELVEKRTRQLAEEQKKTETLLHRMLPESVAKQLIQEKYVVPESFDAVSIFFSDIVGFTKLSAESTPMEVVTFLNDLYTLFDSIISNYQVYKVETIGDAYMVVSGLPERNKDTHCTEIASMALELLESIKTFRIYHRPNEVLQLRIGIHTGPVVAGVVGLKMPRYCLFGDTVNTSSRMESNGEALKIHISPEFKDCIEPTNKYIIQERGLVYMKGKGNIRTYWLMGHVDGPQPRLAPNKDDQDYPFIVKDKSKAPHITLFEDELMTSNRKGSLVTFGPKNLPHSAANNYKKLTGRGVLASSILRLKSTYSNSCSTFSNVLHNDVRDSPKQPSKRNWNLKFLNGKLRSMSSNQQHADCVTNNISMKETKTPKGIIKSPSYNMIETMNHSLKKSHTEIGSLLDSVDAPNRHPISNPISPLIGELRLNDGRKTTMSGDGDAYRQDDSDLMMNEECREDKPLLSKAIHTRIANTKNIQRQSSLTEEEEEYPFETKLNNIEAININEQIDTGLGQEVFIKDGINNLDKLFPNQNCDNDDINSEDANYLSSSTQSADNVVNVNGSIGNNHHSHHHNHNHNHNQTTTAISNNNHNYHYLDTFPMSTSSSSPCSSPGSPPPSKHSAMSISAPPTNHTNNETISVDSELSKDNLSLHHHQHSSDPNCENVPVNCNGNNNNNNNNNDDDDDELFVSFNPSWQLAASTNNYQPSSSSSVHSSFNGNENNIYKTQNDDNHNNINNNNHSKHNPANFVIDISGTSVDPTFYYDQKLPLVSGSNAATAAISTTTTTAANNNNNCNNNIDNNSNVKKIKSTV